MNRPRVIRNKQGERLDVAMTQARGQPTMSCLAVIGHGVTSHHDRPYLVALSEALAAVGWTSARVSFAGNGASEGRFEDCTLSKEVDDLGAVIDAFDARRTAYVGHSMGAAVGALRAAADARIDALVSLAGMTHVQRFMHQHFAALTPGRDVMLGREHAVLSQALLDDARAIGDVLDAAARIRCPWLIVHGDADDLVPVTDSQDLAEAAPGDVELRVLAGVDHVFTGHAAAVAELVAHWLGAQLSRPKA